MRTPMPINSKYSFKKGGGEGKKKGGKNTKMENLSSKMWTRDLEIKYTLCFISETVLLTPNFDNRWQFCKFLQTFLSKYP